jgi:hypothetical protein
MSDQNPTGPKAFNWKPVFLKALREYPVLRFACDAAGVNRSTAWRARKTDAEFAQAWDDCLVDGVDQAEQEAYRRAVFGWEEPVIDKGNLAYRTKRVVCDDGSVTFELVLDNHGQPVPLTVRKHSDALLALVLKGRRKEVYADRTELTGADGAPVALDQTVRATRVARLVELAQIRKTFGEDLT